jgi:hypothetical protein
MRRAIQAGAAYFGAVFLVGFALGTVRVLALVPRIGELRAVLLELPVILAASWALCGWAQRRFGVPPVARDRLAMGGVAFGLLMIAEAALSFGLGRSPGDYLSSFATAAGAAGLAGQIAFALFPLVRVPR